MKKQTRICFVAPATWPVLTGDRIIEGAGGAEVQQNILSKALVRQGYPVSMICLDYGQDDNVEIDGIRVLKTHKPNTGIPIFRFLHPRMTSFWKAMKKADADIYYQRSAGMMTGLVAAFCKTHHRKFIYAAASDTDFMPGKEMIRYTRDKVIYKWGLSRADAVVVQNNHQYQMASQLGIRDITVVNNAYSRPRPYIDRITGTGRILWVGTIKSVKRPELFIALARALPELKFTMIGKLSGNTGYDSPFLDEISKLSNLTYQGFIPFAEIETYFAQADVVVNTSRHEGFPNTFLQAWARGIPTLSFFMPGNGNQKNLPGVYVQTTDEAIAALLTWYNDEGERKKAGRECLEYFMQHHETETIIPHYEDLFSRLLAGTVGDRDDP